MKTKLCLVVASIAWLILVVTVFTASAQKPASGKHPYASDTPLPEPKLFSEGVISTPEDELNAAFTPDGQTVFFTRLFPGNKLGVILVSHFKNGQWQTPEIASFSVSGLSII